MPVPAAANADVPLPLPLTFGPVRMRVACSCRSRWETAKPAPRGRRRAPPHKPRPGRRRSGWTSRPAAAGDRASCPYRVSTRSRDPAVARHGELPALQFLEPRGNGSGLRLVIGADRACGQQDHDARQGNKARRRAETRYAPPPINATQPSAHGRKPVTATPPNTTHAITEQSRSDRATIHRRDVHHIVLTTVIDAVPNIPVNYNHAAPPPNINSATPGQGGSHAFFAACDIQETPRF